jgi:hypothetical protein
VANVAGIEHAALLYQAEFFAEYCAEHFETFV